MATQNPNKKPNLICTCGSIPADGADTAVPGVAILTCAGGSNTGQITNAAGIMLAKNGVGYLACLAGVGAEAKATLSKLARAQKVAVIDGCSVACGKGMMDKAGIKTDYYLQVMDLGIRKDPGVLDPDPEAVARVVSAVTAGIQEAAVASGMKPDNGLTG
ncbi:MAG: putative zinc-binding protein [Bacillota bacterium]